MRSEFPLEKNESGPWIDIVFFAGVHPGLKKGGGGGHLENQCLKCNL